MALSVRLVVGRTLCVAARRAARRHDVHIVDAEAMTAVMLAVVVMLVVMLAVMLAVGGSSKVSV